MLILFIILYGSDVGWTVASGLAQAPHTPGPIKSHCKGWKSGEEEVVAMCPVARSSLCATGGNEHSGNLANSADLGLGTSLSVLAGGSAGETRMTGPRSSLGWSSLLHVAGGFQKQEASPRVQALFTAACVTLSHVPWADANHNTSLESGVLPIPLPEHRSGERKALWSLVPPTPAACKPSQCYGTFSESDAIRRPSS